MKEEAMDFYKKNSQLLDLYRDIIPLKRMGTSEDVVNAMIYLCSEKAAYITGQNIIIDGGLSLIWQESLSRKLTQKEINIVR
jgi:NAD(P)-dependent dehydrogenase (short-subunit alcohol dehydrogenase family)